MKPSSIFRKALLASVISSTFVLTGCGGSDDDETTTTPPPEANNKAPSVNIVGEAQAKEQTEFTLTADATDSDGSIASYAWTHNSDLELTLSGADSSEFTVKSPDISEDTAVTFTLTVTDDDGASASIDKAVVIKRRVSSVTITGIVTDKPIQNANLTIFAGNSSINAVADETGRYTATFTVDESEAEELVQIRATGLGDQDNVEFVSQLNSMDKLVEQANEDGELTSDENFGVNITNVTTAEYALLTRDGEAYSTDEELQQALLNVDAEQKLKLAALIKIVVDNDDYELPEGVSSTLDLVDDETTATQFEQEVTERDPELIEKTEEDIKKDDDLVTDSTTLGAGSYIIHSPEFVTNAAYHITLGEEGKGGSINAVNQVEITAWSISEGKLEATLAEPLIISQGSELKRNEDGSIVRDEFGNMLYEDVFYKTSKVTLQVLAENDVYRTIDFTTHAQRFVEGQLDESYEAGNDAQTVNLLDKGKTLEVTAEDMLGTWYLDVYDNNRIEDEAPNIEKLTLLADGSVEGEQEGETITWKIENNLLTFTHTELEDDKEVTGSMTMWITKSLAAGYQFVAMDNGTTTDASDAHAKSEWGWLFKQDPDLTMTKEQVIGRWHGFIGFNQDRYDLVIEDDLNVKIGLNESSMDGRFEDGVFYRERYREDGRSVRFCDVSQDNCQLTNQMVHEFIAVEDDKYFIRRTSKAFYPDGTESVTSDILAIYEYNSEVAYTEFAPGLLASNTNFYTYDAEGKLIEGSFEYGTNYETDSFVSEVTLGEQTYVFSLVDGKLEYNTPDGRFVVELIEHTDTGLKVCAYPQGESCTDENTVVWSFQIPHVGEFFINNPEYFHSSTFKIHLNRYKSGSIKLNGSTEEHNVSWYLEDGAIVLPLSLLESSGYYSSGYYEEVYLDSIKLEISENGSVIVKESRITYRDGNYIQTVINEYDSKKMVSSDFMEINEEDILGSWVVDTKLESGLRQDDGLYTFSDGFVGTIDLGIIDGSEVRINFNWEIVDGRLKIMHSDGITVEQFYFTKSLRVDGFQAVVVNSEYSNTKVGSSFMVKNEGTLPLEKSDYVGNWKKTWYGEDDTEEQLDYTGMEIYDNLEVRSLTTIPQSQGELVKDGVFTLSTYINPLDNNKRVKPCDTSLDTCYKTSQITYTPLATEGSLTYFKRNMTSYSNGQESNTFNSLTLLEKADVNGIQQLYKNRLYFDLFDADGVNWRSTILVPDGENSTYSLQVGDAAPLPYTFSDGKITIRLEDGLVYNIELVPGSNTKDGVTLCQYLASESCESGEKVQLNFPNLYQ